MKLNAKLLQDLRQSLDLTLSLFIKNSASSDETSRLIDIIRKIELTILLQSKDIFAIGGTQGAGKTTLIKEMLNIPDEWLTGNPGRGEQVPLFIEQVDSKDHNKPYATCVCLDKSTQQIYEEGNISSEQLNKILRGWDNLSSSDFGDNIKILYPKLYVPCEQVLVRDAINWVLLPGYEKENNKNRQWQSLMKHILVNASGIIIATDGVLLANHNQNDIVDDLQDFFIHRTPVIAITKTEGMSAEDKQQLKNSASRVYNIGLKQRTALVADKNIVLTGSGNRHEWHDTLQQCISEFIYSSAALESSVINAFGEILDDDLEFALDTLTKLEQKTANNNSQRQDIIEETLGAFNKAAEDYESKLRKALNKALQPKVSAAAQRCEDVYREEEEGFVNNMKILGRRLAFQGEDVQRDRVARIQKAWTDQFSERTQEEMIYDVVSDVNLSNLKRKGVIAYDDRYKTAKLNDDFVAPYELLGYGDDLTFSSDNMPGDTLNELLYGQIKPTAAVIKSSEDKTKALELLPVLMMETARGNLLLQQRNVSLSDLPAEIRPQAIFEQLFAGKETLTPIRASMLALLGIDAKDSKTGGNNKKDEGMLAPLAILGKAAVALTVAHTLYQVTGIVRESDKAQIFFIKNSLHNMASEFVQDILDQYNEAIELVSEILEQNLKTLYEVPDGLSLRSDIAIAQTRLEKIQKYFKGYLADAQKILA
ncbi:hypothetical protein [Enterobacter sp.]|uniref:hypothetical protein n=1 Tax=Enterobacter sp. TaxID=42895 RepID=UPI00296F5C5C|nr:hypothetical protein [Enterobacter sp.]